MKIQYPLYHCQNKFRNAGKPKRIPFFLQGRYCQRSEPPAFETMCVPFLCGKDSRGWREPPLLSYCLENCEREHWPRLARKRTPNSMWISPFAPFAVPSGTRTSRRASTPFGRSRRGTPQRGRNWVFYAHYGFLLVFFLPSSPLEGN